MRIIVLVTAQASIQSFLSFDRSPAPNRVPALRSGCVSREGRSTAKLDFPWFREQCDERIPGVPRGCADFLKHYLTLIQLSLGRLGKLAFGTIAHAPSFG